MLYEIIVLALSVAVIKHPEKSNLEDRGLF